MVPDDLPRLTFILWLFFHPTFRPSIPLALVLQRGEISFRDNLLRRKTASIKELKSFIRVEAKNSGK